ncbi:MAG TPA: SDR family oxidoreductase [Gemmatimonadaceae bacterium]|nr:SDR family oxidoreductase [Gemmatimonadaceae bacterium]
MTGPLAERTAAVVGGSRGIGLATAQALAGAGARVALLARQAETLALAAAALPGNAVPIVCDVRDSAAVTRAVAELTSEFGEAPHIVVCAAGVFPLAPVSETEPAEFADALAANLLGPFLLVRALLPAMLDRKYGHLVLIGSVADRYIYPGNGAYAATKFGARALWEVLRLELRGTGVRTTLVAPGPTDTQIWDAHDPDAPPGFLPRAAMLRPAAIGDAVCYAVTRPAGVNVDELRVSPA